MHTRTHATPSHSRLALSCTLAVSPPKRLARYHAQVSLSAGCLNTVDSGTCVTDGTQLCQQRSALLSLDLIPPLGDTVQCGILRMAKCQQNSAAECSASQN